MNPTLTTIRVPLLTNIFAGASIPDDWREWQIRSFRDIRIVDGASQFDKFAAVEVEGESLKDVGILPGDVLVFKITDRYREGQIGIWQTPSGRTAKYATDECDGTVKLHNTNGWSQNWNVDEIKLLGVVVRMERDLQ